MCKAGGADKSRKGGKGNGGGTGRGTVEGGGASREAHGKRKGRPGDRTEAARQNRERRERRRNRARAPPRSFRGTGLWAIRAEMKKIPEKIISLHYFR